jgi:hypothetical protein
MDFARIIKIFTAPSDYWNEVIAEPGDIKSLLVPQMLILAAVPAVCLFLGTLFSAMGLFLKLGMFGRLFGGALVSLILYYGLSIGVWILFGLFINVFAETFGAQKDFGQAMKLATGATIPMWLGQVLFLIPVPMLGMLGALAGLGYGCYMLYLGMPVMNGTPQEKAAGYIAVSVVITAVAGSIAFMIGMCPASCLTAAAVVHPY